MASNSFGLIYRFTSFGESHGPAIGVVLDGLPAGMKVEVDRIQRDLDLRKPLQGAHTSCRKEADRVRVLSGVKDSLCVGSPVMALVENEDARTSDYEEIQKYFRPSHADFTYHHKYKGLHPVAGGGRSSARETVARVIAGSVAMQNLEQKGVWIQSKLLCAGGCFGNEEEIFQKVIEAKQQKDSLGGIVEIKIQGLPVGIGEPCYEGLDARLSHALMSVNGVKGIEIGDGFLAASMKGSDFNDQMNQSGFLTNHSGGILGGISTGQEVIVRVAFKPTPSILLPQKTLTRTGEETEISIRGRHDPCIAIRGKEVVRAMAACTVFDLMLAGGFWGSSE